MSTTMATPAAPTAHATSREVADRFLAALASQRVTDLGELLAPNVWLRALLTRHVHESTDASGAMAAFHEWFGSAHQLVPLELAHQPVPGVRGRERLRYRFLLRPEWAPERWHVIEQTGYCKVHDGLITRIDLTCTGFHPIDDPSGALLAPPT